MNNMFIKYPAILTQHSSTLATIPLDGLIFDVQEKYDGANVSLLFVAGQDPTVRVYTRNQELRTPADIASFYSLDQILARTQYVSFISRVWEWMSAQDSPIKCVQVCGELYGPTVQNRVDYGPTIQLVWFDVYIDRQLQVPTKFVEWMRTLGFETMAAPILMSGPFAQVTTSIDTCRDRIGRPIEGIVCKARGWLFVKIKTLEFEDESPGGELLAYITVNRIKDCRTKQPWSNLATFVVQVVSDAVEQYEADIGKNITLDATRNKDLTRRVMQLCRGLYNLRTGESLSPQNN